jgi:hypothetical protein
MIGDSTKRFQKGYQNPYLNDEMMLIKIFWFLEK